MLCGYSMDWMQVCIHVHLINMTINKLMLVITWLLFLYVNSFKTLDEPSSDTSADWSLHIVWFRWWCSIQALAYGFSHTSSHKAFGKTLHFLFRSRVAFTLERNKQGNTDMLCLVAAVHYQNISLCLKSCVWPYGFNMFPGYCAFDIFSSLYELWQP